MRRPVCAGLAALVGVCMRVVAVTLWGLAGKQPGLGECVHGVCCRVVGVGGVRLWAPRCTVLHMHVMICIAGAGWAGMFTATTHISLRHFLVWAVYNMPGEAAWVCTNCPVLRLASQGASNSTLDGLGGACICLLLRQWLVTVVSGAEPCIRAAGTTPASCACKQAQEPAVQCVDYDGGLLQHAPKARLLVCACNQEWQHCAGVVGGFSASCATLLLGLIRVDCVRSLVVCGHVLSCQ